LLKLRENWRNGQGPQTLREMRAFNRERREVEQAAQKLAEDKSRTLGGYWEAEHLPRAKLSMTASSIGSNTNVMKTWLKPLADRLLSGVTPADLENLVIRPMQAAGKSPGYVEKVLLSSSKNPICFMFLFYHFFTTSVQVFRGVL